MVLKQAGYLNIAVGGGRVFIAIMLVSAASRLRSLLI